VEGSFEYGDKPFFLKNVGKFLELNNRLLPKKNSVPWSYLVVCQIGSGKSREELLPLGPVISVCVPTRPVAHI
jgi:hypothetical protein